MVNILVPTDFSKVSQIAAAYGIAIANTLGGNVTLLHIIDIGQKFKATLRMKGTSRSVLNDVKNNFNEMMKELIKEDEPAPPVTYKIGKGITFIEAVAKEAVTLRSGLIVMGTRGAAGLKKALIGSNTASLIGTSHIPILAVPEEASFTGFRNVVYATDLKNLEKELRLLIPYVQKFESTIHILHIVESGERIDQIEERIGMTVKKIGYDNIVTLVTFDTDVIDAIDHYISVTNADLLAMFTHQPTFYEKVFDKSVTRNMAFHSRIPVLAFKAFAGRTYTL